VPAANGPRLIRKQQKELINLLQRSHSVADLSSVVSFNSISTNVTPIDNKSITSNITFSSSALAAENRPWLNNYSGSITDSNIKNGINKQSTLSSISSYHDYTHIPFNGVV
jgi:hypothetical protein